MFLFMNRSACCQTTGQPVCKAEPDLSWDCQVDPYAPLTLVAALEEIEGLRNVLREQWDHLAKLVGVHASLQCQPGNGGSRLLARFVSVGHLQVLGQAIEQARSALRHSNKGHSADCNGPSEDSPRQD